MSSNFTFINDECVEVYKGSNYDKKCKKSKRVMVFDLDETLGSFIELNLLNNIIEQIGKNNCNISFDELLDIYPEFLRNNIIHILKYIYRQKTKKKLDKLYLYTNNQSRGKFVDNIISYFTNKVAKKKDKLFDQIIYAFKINNQIVQIGRTSHNKTYQDFIQCTLLPKNTHVCFIDDFDFDEMKKEQIYYIQPKPYRHGLSSNEIIDRLYQSPFFELIDPHMLAIKELFLSRCVQSKIYSLHSSRNNAFKIMQDEISKKIMYYVKDYFYITNKIDCTRKKKKMINHFTRKNKVDKGKSLEV